MMEARLLKNDECYNQKFLSGDDKEFVRGFDWCAEEAVDNFFDNNYDYDNGEYLAHILTQKVPECLRETYTMEYAFGDRPDEERTIETYADLIRFELLHWIEMQRVRYAHDVKLRRHFSSISRRA